ncbi:unnamed protein product, partial [Ascophyllum nodosum]
KTRRRRGQASSRGASEAPRTSSLDSAVHVLLSRSRQLLWTFWRRRQVVRLRTGVSARVARLRRHPWGDRLLLATATLLAGVFWFLVIFAVAGPPVVGETGLGKEGKDEDSNYGGGGASGEDTSRTPSYYTRIVSEIGVGPSLSDPWVVREIDLAVAEWGLGLNSRPAAGVAMTSRSNGAGAGVLPRPQSGGAKGKGVDTGWRQEWEWDERVNGVVIGDVVPANTTRRHTDLLLTIFSGTTEADASKRELLRQIYDKYEGWITVGGPNSITGSKNPVRKAFKVALVFIMSKETAPPEGELIGDILYVPVPEGYHNIVLKTKAMLRLVQYYNFKFLLKADDDSFVCLRRITSMLHDMDPAIHDRVYAGVPTYCNNPTNPDYWNGRVMKDPNHQWFDSKYVQHTLGGLDCFPSYMQGAFYILSQALVEYLFRGHEHLECFTNEDVTIGSWLMGVDREMVEMYNLRNSHLWDCLCARTTITAKTRSRQQFFHNCKGMSQLKLCGTRLLRPGIGC